LNGRKILSDNAEVLMFGASIRLTHLTGLTFVSLDASELPDLTGHVLHNRYRLMGRLRSGTRTALYKAEDQRVSRTVAVKILCPPMAAYHGYLEHLNREAQLAAKLQHPRIAKVWDCGLGEIDAPEGKKLRVHYVCTEFMGGGSLSDRLHESKPQTIVEVAAWLMPVADALDHAHRNDIVHNGLKATSVVFDHSAQPYVTDFAFASEAGGERQRIFLGAPEFMAPEQWDGRPSTHATDQYALAAVIYYAVAGVMPYENQQDPDMRRRNYERGLTPLHEEASRRGMRTVPKAVSGVIARAMEIDPNARYAALVEFANAFREAIAGKGESHLVFLSYRRDCSAAWAELFNLKLKSHGVSSFFDTQLQDSAGYFPSSLERAIEQCEVFVCFLAANTLQSAWVREEIRLALVHGKKMIPVLQEDFVSPEATAQEEEWMRSLLGHQGVHLLDRKNIYVDETVAKLAKMILGRA
jgi:serine/threonine protein kinase